MRTRKKNFSARLTSITKDSRRNAKITNWMPNCIATGQRPISTWVGVWKCFQWRFLLFGMGVKWRRYEKGSWCQWRWFWRPEQKSSSTESLFRIFFKINTITLLLRFKAVCKWMSKVISRLRLLRLVIGSKISPQFFNQWEARPKPRTL